MSDEVGKYRTIVADPPWHYESLGTAEMPVGVVKLCDGSDPMPELERPEDDPLSEGVREPDFGERCRCGHKRGKHKGRWGTGYCCECEECELFDGRAGEL